MCIFVYTKSMSCPLPFVFSQTDVYIYIGFHSRCVIDEANDAKRTGLLTYLKKTFATESEQLIDDWSKYVTLVSPF